MDIGEVHASVEIALRSGAAAGHGVNLEEPGFNFGLVAGDAERSQVPQQVAGLARLPADRTMMFHGC